MQTVIHAKSAVENREPVDLEYGQIAVNYHFRYPRLYVRNTRDEIVAINQQATTSRRGVAEIATRNQALGGTNNTTIITPKRLEQVISELGLDGIFDGGDAAGNTVIDNGSASTTDFNFTMDGGNA